MEGTATPGEGQTPPGEEEGDANDDEDGDDKNEGGCSPYLSLCLTAQGWAASQRTLWLLGIVARYG